MKVTPLNDRVLIKRLEANEEVRGGIIIPDTANEVKINDVEHIIVREDEILGIVS